MIQLSVGKCHSAMLWLCLTVAIIAVVSGETIDEDNNMEFDDAPDTADGDYALNEFDYDAGTVTTLYSMVNTYMDLVFGSLTAESLSAVNTTTISMSDPMGMVTMIQDFGLLFYLANIGVGFLVLLCFCPCCLCFWCCRICCNNCGGKMEQKDPGRGCCLCLSVTVFITTACLGASAGCSYLLVADMYPGSQSLLDDVPMIVTDIAEFTDETMDGLTYLLGEPLTFTTDSILTNFVSSGEDATDNVTTSLQDNIDTALGGYDAAVIGANDTYNAMVIAIQNLNTLAYDIDAELETIQASLQSISCDENGCSEASSVDELDTLCSYEFDTSVDIQTLDLQTSDEFIGSSIVDDLTSELDSSLNSNVLGSMTSQLDSLTNLTSSFNLSAMIPELDVSEYETLLNEYEKYFSYAGLGMAALPGLAAVFSLLGILMGVIGYSHSTPPTERSKLSSCGGCCLMLSACTSCCYFMLYMLLTVIMFMSLSFITYTVSMLLSPEGLDAMMTLAESLNLFDTSTFENILGSSISFDTMFSECEQHSSIINALGLWNINLQGLPLTDMLNVTQLLAYLEVDTDFITTMTDSITFENIELLSADTTNEMSDAVNNFDISTLTDMVAVYDNYYDELSDNSLGVKEVYQLLNGYMEDMEDDSAPQSDINIVDIAYSDLTDIESNLDILKDAVTAAEKAVDDFETAKVTLASEIDLLAGKLDDVQAQFTVDLETTITDYLTSSWETALDWLQDYLNYLQDMLNSNVGNCYPIYVVYMTFYNMITYVFTLMNSIWFTTGMISFFSLFNAIFSIKLAKFFRKMKMDENFDQPGRNGKPQIRNQNHNQVVPGKASQGW